MDIIGAPRVYFLNEVYTGNGDMCAEVLNLYAVPVMYMMPSSYEMSINDALTDTTDWLNDYKARAMI